MSAVKDRILALIPGAQKYYDKCHLEHQKAVAALDQALLAEEAAEMYLSGLRVMLSEIAKGERNGQELSE